MGLLRSFGPLSLLTKKIFTFRLKSSWCFWLGLKVNKVNSVDGKVEFDPKLLVSPQVYPTFSRIVVSYV